MFKIISRKKYKELLAAQEKVNTLQAETEKVKGCLNELYGVNASVNHNRTQATGERNFLAEQYRKAEDCIDDIYTLLSTISDKCNIRAIKVAKSRLGAYYSNPKVNAAIDLSRRCAQSMTEKKEEMKVEEDDIK